MAVSSPCNRICTLDPASGLCLGCGRTAAEIGGWLGLTEAERLSLMAELPARLALIRRPAARPAARTARRA